MVVEPTLKRNNTYACECIPVNTTATHGVAVLALVPITGLAEECCSLAWSPLGVKHRLDPFPAVVAALRSVAFTGSYIVLMDY